MDRIPTISLVAPNSNAYRDQKGRQRVLDTAHINAEKLKTKMFRLEKTSLKIDLAKTLPRNFSKPYWNN
jgi:hypothetical protein